MNWITVLWPMVAGACVTLGLINLWIATGDGRRAPHLFFALSAFAAAVINGFELTLMQTTDLARYEAILRWAVVPVSVMLIGYTGFVWTFFGTGRKWLGLTAIILNTTCQWANLVTPVPGVRHAVALRQVETWGGVYFTVPTIVNGPLNVILIFSLLLLMVYFFDASLTLWKQGGQRRALIVGGSVLLSLVISRGHACLVEEGIIQTPYIVSFSFVVILIAMGYELSAEVLRASKLAQSLRESEHRMSLAAEAAHLGMWVWDATRDEVWMTETGRTLFGYEPGRRLNYAAFLERVHPDDRAFRDATVKQSLETHKTYNMEFRALLPDGTVRWIASRGGYMETGNGRENKLLGISMDITAQKEAEERLNRQREEIAHLGRISMMGQLSSSLTHELNQPLGAILRNAEAAEIFLKSDKPDLEELRSIITDIRRDDQRAGDVIDRMRGLLKRRDIGLAPVIIGELLERVAAIVRSDAAARQVTMGFNIEPRLPQVRADRVHIQQVVLNLLLNAMDAMKDMPVGQRRMMLGASLNAESQVEVTVSDTGPGVTPGKMAQIFEPFFTTKAQGMGMGLAISQTIIEAHRGRIWAENSVYGGAIFRFTLMVEKEESVS